MNSHLNCAFVSLLLAVMAVALPSSLPAGEASPHLRHLTKEWKGGPGLLAAMASEAKKARWQAFIARGAVTGGKARKPLQVTLNVLSGAKSEDFDKTAPNPGDGYGLENYLRDALGEAALAVEGEGLDGESKLHAAQILRALENMREHVTKAVELCRVGVKTSTEQQVLDSARLALDQLYFAEKGFDGNRSGEIDPDEGALRMAMEEGALLKP